MNPNASSDVENATGDGNATGKKQASKSSIIKPSDDSKQLSEGVKCRDDEDLSSDAHLLEWRHIVESLGVGGEESIPRKKNLKNIYRRACMISIYGSLRCKKLDVANVAGRRVFTRAAADAILHQRGRVHGNVWDRLGKLPEGGSFANANMKGVEKIKEEVFECYGESTELNQSTHSLHDGRKFCGRLSEYFYIKTGASKDGHKRQFSDISPHQSGVSDSMDEEDAFIKKDRRLLPEEDSGVLSENCVSSGAGTPKSQKMGSAFSYSTPVTKKLSCKDNNNVTANLNPVHKQLMDMKLRLEQLETEIVKLQSKKVEKKEQSSSKSGSFNHLEGGESRTVVVKNVHIAATREALRSYFAKCGAVDRVIKLTDTVGIKQKAYAFVTFSSEHSADKALALSGKSFFSRIIWVRRTGELLQKSRCAPHNGRRECSTTTVPIYSGGGGSGSRRPTKYTL
ncbi:hypothetical protein OIU84_011281 [Salix udensis]|uniref:RRM domain-containing protein n=1 Tax=Salix udensis TaxID=889485 RepID=A0AAD6JPN6_9ROSI|nr:hypothetical protein OIU84_011281 [Salix udensis]